MMHITEYELNTATRNRRVHLLHMEYANIEYEISVDDFNELYQEMVNREIAIHNEYVKEDEITTLITDRMHYLHMAEHWSERNEITSIHFSNLADETEKLLLTKVMW